MTGNTMQRTSRVAEARCAPMFFLQTTALTLSSFFDKVSFLELECTERRKRSIERVVMRRNNSVIEVPVKLLTNSSLRRLFGLNVFAEESIVGDGDGEVRQFL
uniref:Uncharacterized protein n=1 Tax=Spongospora subterranea TaxID=70186 RepID=A0A0H5QLH8_9EUKA|eukprot:CRZ02457.1 hypothetical protein [Spongospora subterranea]